MTIADITLDRQIVLAKKIVRMRQVAIRNKMTEKSMTKSDEVASSHTCPIGNHVVNMLPQANQK